MMGELTRRSVLKALVAVLPAAWAAKVLAEPEVRGVKVDSVQFGADDWPQRVTAADLNAEWDRMIAEWEQPFPRTKFPNFGMRLHVLVFDKGSESDWFEFARARYPEMVTAVRQGNCLHVWTAS